MTSISQVDETLAIRVLVVLIEHHPSLAIDFARRVDSQFDLFSCVANWNPDMADKMPDALETPPLIEEALGSATQQA
jgi:hypothetical protein